MTPHVLRHNYASLAADFGLADATIAALLGHTAHSLAMTACRDLFGTCGAGPLEARRGRVGA